MRLRTEDVAYDAVESGMVLVDLRTSRTLRVNAVGSTLVQALADESSPQRLVDLLLASFEVDRETAEADVASFLAELGRLDLLVDGG
jgi:hypothetical protein